MDFGWQELLVILAIVVIIFGGSKIAGVGKASGRAIREFKDELRGSEAAPNQIATAASPAPNPAATMSQSAPPAAESTIETTPPGQTNLR
jgi:sec-independent protein translocase protein TatA